METDCPTVSLSAWQGHQVPLSRAKICSQNANLSISGNEIIIGKNINIIKVTSYIWMKSPKDDVTYPPFIIYRINGYYDNRLGGLPYNGIDGFSGTNVMYIKTKEGDSLDFAVEGGWAGQYTIRTHSSFEIEIIG